MPISVDEMVEYENQCMNATGRYPEGRSIPAAACGGDGNLCMSRTQFWRWVADKLHDENRALRSAKTYPCPGHCGRQMPKRSCEDCGFTAMEKSRREQGW